ncbi:MAG: hypothetical protein K8I30_07920 [Anaerolineae bacterium]|nr:hypothetical protein [Anaerolineae bacterium]
MRSWDEVTEFYRDIAGMRDAWNINLGNAYLKVIQLLLADAETASTCPGTAMYTLYLALSDYDNQSVHIHWVREHDFYDVFLTPEPNDAPDSTRVTLSEVIPTVKAFLQQLRIKRDQP